MWKTVLGLVGLCFGTVTGFWIGITGFWLAGVVPGAAIGAVAGAALGGFAGAVLDKRARPGVDCRRTSASQLIGGGVAAVLIVLTVLLVLLWMGWIN